MSWRGGDLGQQCSRERHDERLPPKGLQGGGHMVQAIERSPCALSKENRTSELTTSAVTFPKAENAATVQS